MLKTVFHVRGACSTAPLRHSLLDLPARRRERGRADRKNDNADDKETLCGSIYLTHRAIHFGAQPFYAMEIPCTRVPNTVGHKLGEFVTHGFLTRIRNKGSCIQGTSCCYKYEHYPRNLSPSTAPRVFHSAHTRSLTRARCCLLPCLFLTRGLLQSRLSTAFQVVFADSSVLLLSEEARLITFVDTDGQLETLSLRRVLGEQR